MLLARSPVRHRLIASIGIALLSTTTVLPCALAQVAAPSAAEISSRELLNSERIETRFGSYGIDVLSSDSQLRVSNLFSTHPSGAVTRTFALVAYPSRVDSSFAQEHALILNGASIGAAFAAEGWRVLKSHRYFGELSSTARLEQMMKLDQPAALALHIYVLSIEKGRELHDYATIAEIHHPDYLRLDDLLAIYAPDWSGNDRSDESVARMLEIANDIPGSLP